MRIALARGPMLIAPTGIALDARGRVLVGVDGSRVHVYDGEGRFLAAWPLPEDAAGGRLRILASGDDPILVAAEQSGRVLGFDLEGALVSDARDPEAFARLGPAQDRSVSADGDLVYSIGSGGLVRLRPEPETLLVPPLHWPLAGLADRLPLVPVLLLAGGVAIFAGLALTSRSPAATHRPRELS